MRLLLRPHRERAGYCLDRFDAHLDGELLCTSRQPLLDSARELLRRGHSPETLLTTRHEGNDHDNFVPRPIGELASWTVTERDKKGLRRERWMPDKRYAGGAEDERGEVATGVSF